MQEPTANIAHALESLRAEEDRLIAAEADLKSKLRDVSKERRQISSSIRALTASTRAARPTLPDDEALGFAKDVLQTEGELPEGELHKRVVQCAKSAGFTGTGVHLTLRRVLKSGPFVCGEDGVVSIDGSTAA